MALCYPLMTIFDLFINHRRIYFIDLIIILILTCAVIMSFIGDKLFEDNSFFTSQKKKYKDEEDSNEEY